MCIFQFSGNIQKKTLYFISQKMNILNKMTHGKNSISDPVRTGRSPESNVDVLENSFIWMRHVIVYKAN